MDVVSHDVHSILIIGNFLDYKPLLMNDKVAASHQLTIVMKSIGTEPRTTICNKVGCSNTRFLQVHSFLPSQISHTALDTLFTPPQCDYNLEHKLVNNHFI